MSIGRARGASGSAGKVASSCSSRPWGAWQGIDLLSSDQQSLCQYTVTQRRYKYKHLVAKKMSVTVCQRPRLGFCQVQPQLKIVRLMSTGRFRHARRCDLFSKIFSWPDEIFLIRTLRLEVGTQSASLRNTNLTAISQVIAS